MRYGSIVVVAWLAAGAALSASAPVTIYDSVGTPLSIAVEGLPASVAEAAPGGADPTIDLWCCGDEVMDWSLNTKFYWATAFDTNDITEPHQVTEVLWYSDGGEDETYWIAPDRNGLPDPRDAVLLGAQRVPDSPFRWQSFDASDAGARVQPNRVYWLIRAALGQGFDMTWRTTSNPDPPLPDPVALSLTFNGGWVHWTPGTDWHMEYEIRGVGPCEIRLRVRPKRVSAGGTLELSLDLKHNRLETVTVPLAFRIEDAEGRVWLSRVTAPRTVHAGDQLSTEYLLTVPDSLVPGEYELVVGVEEMQQGQAWATERFTVVGPTR